MRNPEFDEPIVVTGYGAVTPLGLNADESWQNIIDGKSGIVPLPLELQNQPYDVHVIAPVKDYNDELLISETGVIKKDIRRIHLSGKYALLAANEAINRAGLTQVGSIKLANPEINPERLGVNIGSGMAGAESLVEIYETLKAGRLPTPPQTFVALPERVASVIARNIGAQGPSGSMVGACATGNMSLISAIRTLRLGESDIMVAGSVEAQSTIYALGMFAGLTALDKSSDPALASRPFSRTEEGFVIGEGGGILVLERESHAKKRGAIILAVVAGYGETNDAATHDTMATGIGSRFALKRAVDMAGDFDSVYINAHATGTGGDKIELAKAIKPVIPAEKLVAVSSTKGATGHMLGGAGSAEAVFSIKMLETGILPPTLKLEDPIDEAEGINLVPNTAQFNDSIDMVFSNSFGFGGINSVLGFKKPA